MHDPFCMIYELNTEREIVFVLISADSQGDITQVHKWVRNSYKTWK